MNKGLFYTLITLFFLFGTEALKANMTVPIYFTAEEGLGTQAGSITITETKYGLLFMPQLSGLKPEIHGFHVHVSPDCNNNGMAAGGHLDPLNTGKHLGPYNDEGHLGDLPALFVNADGTVNLPVLAPRLMHIDDIKNHALMVHEGGDNYSDAPQKLGGGGARMLCGIIK